MLTNGKPVWTQVDEHKPRFNDLSDRIWDHPELNYQEFHAVGEYRDALTAEGFRVTENLGDIPTAIMGEAGEGGPIIAILGEYDALPGLSQEAGIAEERPRPGSTYGHGCGHNMLGSASMLAAVAVKNWLAETGQPGRVRYYGCPAEEGGSSKSFLVRAGAFDDVDVAICWHPGAFSAVWTGSSLACVELEFTFHGRASHAAVAPELGRSALDAVELMNIGVNYMREHMPSSARVHYAIVDSGGIAPNVVQPRAIVRHLVRAVRLDDMWDLVERVKKIAQGAALMTETTFDVRQLSGEANLIQNSQLQELMQANLEHLSGPGFDAEDEAFARDIQATLSPTDIRAAFARAGLPADDAPLSDKIVPLNASKSDAMGSTDVGTVSWVVPTVQCLAACYAVGTPGHSWQLVAQGKSPAAHKGIAFAAKAMAGVAADLVTKPDLLAEAKAAHAQFRADNEFRNPCGPDAEPPLAMAAG